MKRKFLKYVSVLSASLFVINNPICIRAEDLTYNNLHYRQYDDHIEITGGDGKQNYIIPGQIEGLPVTAIHSGAFQGRSWLRSICIPESIIEIGDDAFSGCDSLSFIYYKGSADEWEKLTVGGGNQKIRFTDVYCDYNAKVVDREFVFRPGLDNWRFANATKNFGTDGYYITDEHYAIMEQRNPNGAYELQGLNRDGAFIGNCFGMAATTVLTCAGILDPAVFGENISCLQDVSEPPGQTVQSIINYYFEGQRAFSTSLPPMRTNAEKLEKLLCSVKNGTPALLELNADFGEFGWGGHAVVPYGVEYGSWEWDDTEYDGRVLIYDVNYPELPEDCNLYFKTDDLSCYTIPCIRIKTGVSGGIVEVIDDLDELNFGGLYCGNLHPESASCQYILTTEYGTDRYQLYDVERDAADSGNGSLIDLTPISYSFKNKTAAQIVLDPEKSYAMRTNEPDTISFQTACDGEAVTFYASNAEDVVLVPEERYAVNGKDMTVQITIADENDSVSVKSRSTDMFSLKRTENGFTLCGSDLHDISLRTEKDGHSSVSIFSADVSEVSITFQKDGEPVVTANGTVLTQETSYLLGDVDHNGVVNAIDATMILIASARMGTGMDTGLDYLQEQAADHNQDGMINSIDATEVLVKAAKEGVGLS